VKAHVSLQFERLQTTLAGQRQRYIFLCDDVDADKAVLLYIPEADGKKTYLSGVTVGRGFFVSFIILGSGVDATGVVGTDISSERRALPPRASKSSACFVFLVPSFIPDPLNVGARNEDGIGDTVLAGEEGPSKRCETGA
jgi:hypothetical protein